MFRQWILTAAILALPTCALAQGATGTGGVQSGLRSGEPLSGVRGGANTTGAGGTGVAGPGGTGVDQPNQGVFGQGTGAGGGGVQGGGQQGGGQQGTGGR
jgi:hypothetical protein